MANCAACGLENLCNSGFRAFSLSVQGDLENSSQFFHQEICAWLLFAFPGKSDNVPIERRSRAARRKGAIKPPFRLAIGIPRFAAATITAAAW
jgi:hypothetical protein